MSDFIICNLSLLLGILIMLWLFFPEIWPAVWPLWYEGPPAQFAVAEHIFAISNGTYPGHVLVVLGVPQDRLLQAIETSIGRSLSDDERAAFDKPAAGRAWTVQGIYVLWVAPPASAAAFHATLAHEIFHIVEFLFVQTNVQYAPMSEAFAYQITHLTEQIYTHIET